MQNATYARRLISLALPSRASVRNMLLAAALLPLLAGCAVPQKRGLGRLSRVTEPQSGRPYWLYLPDELAHAEEGSREATVLRPLVVTFHGMKPFDCANAQIREWQAEADRYGYIVIAPELRSPDVLHQFPVTRLDGAFSSDETAVLAILDHVTATTPADPRRVLSTSWSSGGYVAHYVLNAHPERFSCLAVRQSNFSSEVLDSQRTERSLDHPVLLVGTDNDFGVCRREFDAAREWYNGHGYTLFSWVTLRGLGHERTPEVAAEFFARALGLAPREASPDLPRRQALAASFHDPAGRRHGHHDGPAWTADAFSRRTGGATIPAVGR